MKPQLVSEFGRHVPRAIVLDDHAGSRRMTARSLSKRGFAVEEHSTFESFLNSWRPGMADLIVADWQLSDREHGDDVLAEIRRRDWDVPFVLVSGKLGDDDRRVKVLEVLLRNRSASFVARGSDGITKVCDEGEALIERRDLTLLKVILSLRAAADANEAIQTSAGPVQVLDQLASLVAEPESSHQALDPLSKRRSAQALSRP